MDVAFINPFIQATIDTFRTMMEIDIKTGSPIVRENANHTYDVSGVIGLSGEAQGIISISFPKILALKVASKMFGEELKIIGPELTDSIGEIVNIIAGNAKQYLTKYKLSISLPNVVIGKNHRIEVQTGVKTIVIPLKCPLGEFVIEITLKTK